MSVVDLADVKAHANVTSSTDDALLQAKVDAAEAWIDGWLCKPMAEMDTVPADLKEAVKQLASYYYDNRDAVVIDNRVVAVQVPFGVMDLLQSYRAWVF